MNSRDINKFLTSRGLKASLSTFISYKEILFLEKLVKDNVSDNYKVLEVGSWEGMSSICMANVLKDYKNTYLHCVDTWKMYDDNKGDWKTWEKEGKPDILEIFTNNIRSSKVSKNIIIHVGLSNDKVPLIEETFDLAFIDGNHAYEYVLQDILNILPKMKKGGIICGHDYSRKHPGVIKAVKEVFTNIEVHGSIWSSIHKMNKNNYLN